MSNASARRAVGRFGRPPKKLASEVEERILDATRKAFLERGFEGASIDEIGALGKANDLCALRQSAGDRCDHG